jgi:hypothetical protein
LGQKLNFAQEEEEEEGPTFSAGPIKFFRKYRALIF